MLAAILLLAAGLPAAGKGDRTRPEETANAPEARASGKALSPPAGEPVAEAEPPLKDVYFATNKWALTRAARAILDQNSRWLTANPRAIVVIEGYCDERGTEKYNRALGERRAKAIRDYLVAAGIHPSRLSMASVGKEQAFILGHDEEAWKWNRRAHFVLPLSTKDTGGAQ